MKRVVQALLVTLILLLSFPVIATSQGYSEVHGVRARHLIRLLPQLVVFDVRNETEFNLGHIRNAKNMPIHTLGDQLERLDIDAAMICSTSREESIIASQRLIDNGVSQVYAIKGGMDAWKKAGHPVYIKYESIQENIDSALPGDTLFISSGLYYEHLTINKSLTMIGENREATIVDGNETETVLHLTGSDIFVSGFTFQRSGCACAGPDSGVRIENSQKNITITNNIIKNNGHGIRLDWGDNTIISHNEITGNRWGIDCVFSSSNVTIQENNVTGNESGLRLSFLLNSEISGNRLVNNDYGLQFIQAYNNIVWHNNFITNVYHTYIVSSANTWDNGCEGNYWSNYNGIDTDGDGVGDTLLPWEGVDQHPLMNLFWNPADINHDLRVNIFDAVTMCLAYSSTPGDQTWNPHCDIAAPFSIIDSADVAMLSNYYGKQYTEQG